MIYFSLNLPTYFKVYFRKDGTGFITLSGSNVIKVFNIYAECLHINWSKLSGKKNGLKVRAGIKSHFHYDTLYIILQR